MHLIWAAWRSTVPAAADSCIVAKPCNITGRPGAHERALDVAEGLSASLEAENDFTATSGPQAGQGLNCIGWAVSDTRRVFERSVEWYCMNQPNPSWWSGSQGANILRNWPAGS
jgi:hypothetical protein